MQYGIITTVSYFMCSLYSILQKRAQLYICPNTVFLHNGSDGTSEWEVYTEIYNANLIFIHIGPLEMLYIRA
jgi:hypothetical protein